MGSLRPSAGQGCMGSGREMTSDGPRPVKREQDTTDTTNNGGLSIERGLFSTSYCPHDRFYISTYFFIHIFQCTGSALCSFAKHNH